MKEGKNINIELLRFVSMMMVLMLHYLYQGRVLELTEKTCGITYYLVWCIEGICFVSVNIYMLISGYFLSKKAFSWRRLLSFYATVLFYSLLLMITCFSVGIAPMTIKTVLSVLPIIGSRSNWYVTVYVAILLISPILNIISNSMDKDLYKRMLVILFILFSIFPTVFFWIDQFDVHNGYSLLWYSYLYLIAAYIRRFDISISRSTAAVLLSMLALLPVSKTVISNYFSGTALISAENVFYNYNAFPVLGGALAFFLLAIKKEKKKTIKWVNSLIMYLGKTSFGVFFIHSFVLLREQLWIRLGSLQYIGSPVQIAHGLACVSLVYIVCSLLDFGKSFAFRACGIDAFVRQVADKMDKRYPLNY